MQGWGGEEGRESEESEGARGHASGEAPSVSQSSMRWRTFAPFLHLPLSYRPSGLQVARAPQGPRRHGSLGAILEAGCRRRQEKN